MVNKCKFAEQLTIGQMAVINTGMSKCDQCRKEQNFGDLETVYLGHRTDGFTFDLFAVLSETRCEFCHTKMINFKVPCEVGGAWSIEVLPIEREVENE